MYRHGPAICVNCGEALTAEDANWSERGTLCWRCCSDAAPRPPRDARGRAIALGLAVFCVVHGTSLLFGDRAWWALADLAVALPLVLGAHRSAREPAISR